MQTTRGSQYRSSDLTTINLLIDDSDYLPKNGPLRSVIWSMI
jgi:hypothetical protein